MMTASHGDSARLKRSAQYSILKGPLGNLLLRPWFDGLALWAITRWYLPLSRAWAAGLAAEGSPESFFAALGRAPSASIAKTLRRLEARRAAYDAAAESWEEDLFGPGARGAEALVAAERGRHDAAHRLMAGRALLLPLHLRRALPPIRWEIATPEQVAARHGPRLGAPGTAFPAPGDLAVERSRVLPGAHGPEYWLRFTSTVLGDRVWARVREPPEVANPPTLIFLHGIMMEPEFWHDLADELGGLVRRGLRLICPEGPWHGRRRLAGWYGGEPVMGRGPLGLIEVFQAWVAETAALIDWARQTSRGPVAVGGVSLGTLTSQLVATAARDWPPRLHPDALLLVATSGDLLELVRDGDLGRAVGLSRRIRARGWTEAELARWLPLLAPRGRPALPADGIVMLLGERDRVTPYAGGLALARAWSVPRENLFQRRRGHFSVSLGLGSDPAPVDRLAALLGVA